MTRSVPPNDWRVCARCGYVLDHRADGVWLHPLWMRKEGEDHEPVPVRRTEADKVIEVCDFCFTPNPPWELPVRNFPTPGAAIHVSTSGWAACDVCADLLRRDMWTQLTNRAIRSQEERHGPMTVTQVSGLRRLYREVRRNTVGPPVPNNVHADTDYGDAIPEVTIEFRPEMFKTGDGSRRWQPPPSTMSP